MTNEIIIEKPAQQILKKVEDKYTITNASTLEKASEMRTVLKAELKRITEHKETKTKPMNAALAAVRADYKPFEIPLENAIELINTAMSDYQKAEMKRVRDEEAKIAARVGEGKGKLKIETAVKKLGEIEKPASAIVTQSGGTKFRYDKRAKILDLSKVPTEYLLPNIAMIEEALKRGIVIPGCEIEEVPVPVNTR